MFCQCRSNAPNALVQRRQCVPGLQRKDRRGVYAYLHARPRLEPMRPAHC
jgi:hypothetical protein